MEPGDLLIRDPMIGKSNLGSIWDDPANSFGILVNGQGGGKRWQLLPEFQ
jgi:hypothetical protein